MTVDNVLDALIVGAGFAGLYQSHLLHNIMGYKTRAFEASDQPGGTWNWNRYPGARVDIMSIEYSFKFDKDLYDQWEWKEKFAPQAELMDYVNHLVKRFNLADLLQFKSRVTGANWDNDAKTWTIEVVRANENGSTEMQKWTGRHLILASGCLSSPNQVKFPGQAEFIDAGGEVYYTQTWPREGVDFTGKKVAVIGTGSSNPIHPRHRLQSRRPHRFPANTQLHHSCPQPLGAQRGARERPRTPRAYPAEGLGVHHHKREH